MNQIRTWQQCVAAHGHECGGLAIGYQASRYAIELLDIEFAEDERILCFAEGKGCPLDGIRTMLRCDEGKNELRVEDTGNHAYSFYNLGTGEGVRLTPKQYPEMEKSEMKDFLLNMTYRYLFDKVSTEQIPEA